MHKALSGLLAGFLIAGTGFGVNMAQEKAAPKTKTKKEEALDAEYIARSLSAAPPSVARDAGVVRMKEDGSMDTLRPSKNGFTCMIIVGDTMCADMNSMVFFSALMKHETPPDRLGITYMLRGDNGGSNTDPRARQRTADNHWIVTGPHLMIVGPGSKSFALQTDDDPDPTRPFLMWGNTPYAHVMIPLGGLAPVAKEVAKK